MRETMPSLMSSGAIPDDVALNIASLLEVSDVCCLGSCSKFWCDLCASDSLWLDLTKKRWPHLHLNCHVSPPFQGWKSFYISKHTSLARCASVVTEFVQKHVQNESLEVGNYLKAIDDLRSMELGFKDATMFLLTQKHGVLLNLIGLHYCIVFLGTSPEDLIEALNACRVAERRICVSWFKLGRWSYGFRLPDDHKARKLSLVELAMAAGQEVLGVLNRGAVHEVLRVQITSVKPDAEQPIQIVASPS